MAFRVSAIATQTKATAAGIRIGLRALWNATARMTAIPFLIS